MPMEIAISSGIVMSVYVIVVEIDRQNCSARVGFAKRMSR